MSEVEAMHEPMTWQERAGLTREQLFGSVVLCPIAMLVTLPHAWSGILYRVSAVWFATCFGVVRVVEGGGSGCAWYPDVDLHRGWLGLPFLIPIALLETLLLPFSLLCHVTYRLCAMYVAPDPIQFQEPTPVVRK